MQKSKRELVENKRKEIEKSLDFFVQKSKTKIHDYKIRYKEFFADLEKSKKKAEL